MQAGSALTAGVDFCCPSYRQGDFLHAAEKQSARNRESSVAGREEEKERETRA